eukprot:m.200483 g.200483  ORF g.200483 m.200483 type:complete len:148 (+) comp13710_c0_seq3:5683-6126(+)
MASFSRAWTSIAPTTSSSVSTDKNAKAINTLIVAGGAFLLAIASMVFGITTHRLRKGGYFESSKISIHDAHEYTNPTFDPSTRLSTRSDEYIDLSHKSNDLKMDDGDVDATGNDNGDGNNTESNGNHVNDNSHDDDNVVNDSNISDE